MIPSSTYRLQISKDFTLFDAAALVPYLSDLGVGAVYASPLLRSTTGSLHGYDTVDHTIIDPDRGGNEGMAALASACSSAGLGLVIDIVPNHMGVWTPAENHVWWDVLRLGQTSAWAGWFDIDWQAGEGRVNLPILGDDADLSRDLVVDGDELCYFEHRYPIAPDTGTGTPEEIHDRQHYRLINFRLADTEQNYRRFFAVGGLAAVRVEDREVFDATHREVLRWLKDYDVCGIRIDHPDGLTRPEEYLNRLVEEAPDAWISVEKITGPDEELPPGWPVAGLTGYDALREISCVLVDPGAEAALTEFYIDLTGDAYTFAEHAEDGKRLVATTILRAEVARIARLVPEIDSVPALTELAVAFAVYRSYLPIGQEYLDRAVAAVRQSRPELDAAIDALLPRLQDPDDEVCLRFQQVSGAVMAKGVEDTACYRYTRFIAFNEVGGEPGEFGASVEEFHAAQQHRVTKSPSGMTTLSTHDTKRGEDIRARQFVLAEPSVEWPMTARSLMDVLEFPSGPVGYLLCQTAVAMAVDAPVSASSGAVLRSRLHDYAEKAMREAALGTSWDHPDADFERRTHAGVDGFFDNPDAEHLIAGMAARIAPYARSNSMSQKIIQLTMPGVPDVYQGSEFWEDSLVDPDNRRPVDFATRHSTLAELAAPALAGDGAAKLWIIAQSLRMRRDHPELFAGYTPLIASGAMAAHLIAFDRGGAITLATRLPAGLASGGGWGDTVVTLPAGSYRDVFTGASHQGEVLVDNVLAYYPVALLVVDD